jgi:crotonobetainyl-CoA:carnitine CoA-transferase CaiB-like acyl-CoA transferase
MAEGALAGLRVIDTATLYGAPFIATLLADHGADVIKVEPPGGDPYRHFPSRMWPLLARGKRSIELDLRSEEGCAVLRRLARETDVIVVNMPPTLLTKRGLDYKTLSIDNPGLIMALVTGFGLDGPYADRPGNGSLAEAYAGLTHVTGDPAGPPVIASVPLGDAVTGTMGAFGVLAACYLRLAHGGPGQVVDINPLDALLHVTGPAQTEYTGVGPSPTRLASRLRGSIVRNVFPTLEGEWVTISLSTPRHLEELAELIGHTQRGDDGRPTGDLEATLRSWTSDRTRADIVDTLVQRRLPVAPVLSANDIRHDPHLTARSALHMIVSPEQGVIASPAPAPRLLASPAPVRTRTPELGEHTEEILEGLSTDAR